MLDGEPPVLLVYPGVARDRSDLRARLRLLRLAVRLDLCDGRRELLELLLPHLAHDRVVGRLRRLAEVGELVHAAVGTLEREYGVDVSQRLGHDRVALEVGALRAQAPHGVGRLVEDLRLALEELLDGSHVLEVVGEVVRRDGGRPQERLRVAAAAEEAVDGRPHLADLPLAGVGAS